MRFNAGDRAGALAELERDAAFHRRVARSATALLDKMVAFAILDRIALLGAEMARRAPRGETQFWRRLDALLAPPAREELDVVPAHRLAAAQAIDWMQTRRYARLADATYDSYAQWAPESAALLRRWGALAPWFYRPHQSVNWYAARCNAYLAVAERPAVEFARAVAAADARAAALDPGPFKRAIVNPVGWTHLVLTQGCDAVYIGRAHTRTGVQALAHLVARLRAAGISKPADVAAALDGPLGAAHADPFTGKPMRFDGHDGTVGFDVEQSYLTGVARNIAERYRRMALPL
jgi:hypothetical protein